MAANQVIRIESAEACSVSTRPVVTSKCPVLGKEVVMRQVARVTYCGHITQVIYPVHAVRYTLHQKSNASTAMQAEYYAADQWWTELIEFEGNKTARREAQLWWKDRSAAPLPLTAAEAIRLANAFPRS